MNEFCFWKFPASFDELIALVFRDGGTDRSVSYAELSQRAKGWSERLRALAKVESPLIGLEFETTPEAIAAYLGALDLGFPVLVLEPGQLAGESSLAAIYQPEIILARREGVFDARGTGVRRHLPAPHPDLRLLLSTSGSTGDPKLVRLSDANIASNARSIAGYLDLSPSDRAATTLPLFYSYGLSVLHSYLAAGASLALIPDSVTSPNFWDRARDLGVTSLALVPFQIEALDADDYGRVSLPTLRYVTQAGGRLDPGMARRLHASGRAAGWDLVLMYGQTEAAPRISYVPPKYLPAAADTIGQAIPGGHLSLLAEDGSSIVKPGRTGELVYTGPNVMMGYALRREDLARGHEITALHTGDLAEITADGFFRITGRLGRFVKLYGLRLNLDQIEAMLGSHNIAVHAVAVGDELVLLHKDPSLADTAREAVARAYGLPVGRLRAAHLRDTPLLASGKIDHRALTGLAAEAVALEAGKAPAPINLVHLFRSASRVRNVRSGDSFASLDGNSLSHLEVELALEEVLGEAPASWERMTLAELQTLIADHRPLQAAVQTGNHLSLTHEMSAPEIPKPPPTGSAHRLALHNQERYLLAERFTEATYGTRTTYRINGPLDIDRLRQALHATMVAHPVLRTEFRPHETSFLSVVMPEPDQIDIEEVRAASRETAEIQRLYTDYFFRKPADFVPREMIRTQIIHLPIEEKVSGTNIDRYGGKDGGESLLSLSLHHALSDAVTMGAYTDEVLKRYNGDVIPPAGAPEVTDYATLIAANDADPAKDASRAAARAWWLGYLEGTEAVADVPHDLDGHVPLGDQRIGCLRLAYAPMLRTSRTLKATPFVLMAALSHVVLARYSGRSEVLSTFQSIGRKGVADNSVIGPFSNTLILRTRIDEDCPLPDLIAAQREAIVAAIEHEAYPYHMVVRDTGVQPRFGLNWFPPHPKPLIEGVKVLQREYFYTQTNYDIDLRFVHDGDEVLVYVYCDSGCYSAERIDAILGDLSQALARAVADPKRRIATLLEAPGPLVVAPPTRLPQGRLHDAFLACARAAPDRIALVGSKGSLTYGQLDCASAALARRLIGLGLGPGSRVAILAERGTGLVTSMLSVLRIGATMVPLDANYPEERLQTLFGVAKPDALILPAPGAPPGWAKGVPTLAARDLKASEAPDVAPGALAAGDPDAPAYILFTSGSTGTPKGLATSHRPPLNFLRWQREMFGIGPDDRFTNLNGVAHDMMIRDIFAPLSVGAQLAIPEQADIYRPGRLLEWSVLQRPTVMHLTPAMGNLLALARESGPTGARGETLPLRAMFFGGDRLLPSLTDRIAALAPGATIVNFYGATETPQAAAFHVVGDDRPWRAHPIGRGIENMALRIVDANHKPAPKGAPGEIAVVTPFLSLGYVQGANITPHATEGIYFTGDTGFELPSGEVMFTGRQDDQVSIRGYRIELEEITRTLLAHPAVREAQVLVEGGEAPRLLAFAAGEAISGDELYAWLSRRLPHYMVPADIICLTALPLLPNGKLDRRALLAAPRPSRARSRGRPPETAMERRLATIWEFHLGGGAISPEQSFAELRGDSLNFVQVFLATEAITGQLPDNWENMPLALIAELAAPPPRFYKWIDSAMLVRAFAIVSVAALHLGLYSFGGGSTAALFMVSGYFIGRLQLAEAFRTRSSRPLWRTFGRVLLPCAVYLWIYTGAKLALGLPVHWSIPTFTADFVNYAEIRAAGERGHAIQFWYISAFLQILAAMALLVHANFALRLSDSPAKFLALLFAVALVLRFVLPGLIDPSFFAQGFDSNSGFAHWPTTQLGTLVLGMMLAQAISLRAKLWMAAIVAAYAFGTSLISTTSSWAILLVFGSLILFVPRLPIPKGLHLIILLLSGSSLFIYLTHMQVAGLLEAIGVTEGSILQWLLVLAAGVLVWLGWQWISGWRSGFKQSTFALLQSWREIARRVEL